MAWIYAPSVKIFKDRLILVDCYSYTERESTKPGTHAKGKSRTSKYKFPIPHHLVQVAHTTCFSSKDEARKEPFDRDVNFNLSFPNNRVAQVHRHRFGSMEWQSWKIVQMAKAARLATHVRPEHPAPGGLCFDLRHLGCWKTLPNGGIFASLASWVHLGTPKIRGTQPQSTQLHGGLQAFTLCWQESQIKNQHQEAHCPAHRVRVETNNQRYNDSFGLIQPLARSCSTSHLFSWRHGKCTQMTRVIWKSYITQKIWCTESRSR